VTDQRTFKEKINHWIFGIPAVAQFWAKISAQRTSNLLGQGEGVPFASLRRPLAQSRVALTTTGGIHLPDQPPFNMDDPDGDASYRVIPGDVALADLTITHKYYNHESADRDPQVLFPLDHFRDLVKKGVIGSIAPRHFGLMGHIEGEQLPILLGKTAPDVASMLRADGVDFAFLTPA
jgi:D-proline reductase (dithiol) PrdB